MRFHFLLLILIFISCNSEESKKLSDSDSLDGKSVGEWKDSVRQKIELSINESTLKEDTASIASSPIKILSAKLIKKEYSNYRDMYVSYKNVSDKKVVAIRFEWYGLNAFDEPADMGNSYLRGFGGGFTDDQLSPGRTDNGTWSILSRDGKKVIKAWATEVVFEDGTKWKNKN